MKAPLVHASCAIFSAHTCLITLYRPHLCDWTRCRCQRMEKSIGAHFWKQTNRCLKRPANMLHRERKSKKSWHPFGAKSCAFLGLESTITFSTTAAIRCWPDKPSRASDVCSRCTRLSPGCSQRRRSAISPPSLKLKSQDLKQLKICQSFARRANSRCRFLFRSSNFGF